jgi:hypothetical protein
MTEHERKKMLILADTIQGEINRICVTMSKTELVKMYHHLQNNIDGLVRMKCDDLMKRKEKADESM